MHVSLFDEISAAASDLYHPKLNMNYFHTAIDKMRKVFRVKYIVQKQVITGSSDRKPLLHSTELRELMQPKLSRFGRKALA